MSKYRFIEDPGHGWLEVPTLELVKLGIADKISSCSYVHPSGKTCYLEEDCDAAVFIQAKVGAPFRDARKAWQDWQRDNETSVYQENTPIRNYRPFPSCTA